MNAYLARYSRLSIVGLIVVCVISMHLLVAPRLADQPTVDNTISSESVCRGLKPEFYAAFRKVPYPTSLATYGGLVVIESPLLAREFPDYAFVRRILRTPPGFAAEGVEYTRIFALPAESENSRVFEFPFDLWIFLAETCLTVRNDHEAEHLRRIVMRLTPRERHALAIVTSPRHERVSPSEWKIAIDPKHGYFKVTINAEGRIVSGTRIVGTKF